MSRSTLITPALITIGLLACLAAFEFSEQSAAIAGSGLDIYKISLQDERFAGAAAMIPASESLGYISDLPVDGTVGMALFYSAQYAVAPRLLRPLEKAGSARYVIGNFTRQGEYARPELKLVRDFGEGVVLYERGARNQ